MTTNASKPITELDFFKNREALKNYLKGQARFKDFDFEGSNLSVLLDILAYNTHLNAFYVNMAFSEMFLDSAQLRSSAVSHAKHLNYLPRSFRASEAKVDLTFDVPDNPSFITIPQYTKFTGKLGNKSYTFTTDETHTVIPNGNVYSISDISIYEGRILTEYFEVKEDNETFKISNEKVDTNSIRVKVRETTDPNSTKTEYSVKQNLFGVGNDDPVFYIEPAEEKYRITFGQNVFGRQPSIGNVVEITYRVATGEDPNRTLTFSAASQVSGYDVSVTTKAMAAGGAERESLSSIRYFAPKSIQIQDRAVTANDYEILLKNAFSEIQAVSVYGGEELDPPQFGRVFISVDVKDAEGVSQNAKNKFTQFLKDRTPLAIEPIVVSPQFLYLDIRSTVYYNTKTTAQSPASIKKLVSDAILNYSAESLDDFGRTLRYSRLIEAIDDADEHILSNDTFVRVAVDYVPTLGVAQSASFSFSNKLKADQALSNSQPVSTLDPALISSPFTYNGSSVYLQDDGLGSVHILKSNNDSFVYVKRNVGTVDYEKGAVTISDLTVTDFVGSAIKFYGRTSLKDIIAPKNRIITIRKEDLTINVEGIRA